MEADSTAVKSFVVSGLPAALARLVSAKASSKSATKQPGRPGKQQQQSAQSNLQPLLMRLALLSLQHMAASSEQLNLLSANFGAGSGGNSSSSESLGRFALDVLIK